MSEQEQPALEVHGQQLESVQAETVVLNQSAAQRVDASSVVAQTSPIGSVQAETLTMEASAAGLAQAASADVRQAVIGAAVVEDAALHLTAAGAVLARHDVHVESSLVETVAATGDVWIERSFSGTTLVGGNATISNTYTVFLLAGGGIQAEGEVHTVFDPESARSFGLAFGAVVGIFWLLRLLFRR